MTPAIPDTPSRRIKVMLLTVGLGVGGTEGQVLEIASRLDRRRFEVSVCALKGADVLVHELRARGVRVITLDGKGAWDARVLYRLARMIRAERPDEPAIVIKFESRIAPVEITGLRPTPRRPGWRGRA